MLKKIVLFLSTFVLILFLGTDSSFIVTAQNNDSIEEQLDQILDSVDVEDENSLEKLVQDLEELSEQITGEGEEQDELRRIIGLIITLLTDPDLFKRAKVADILGNLRNDLATMPLVVSLRHDPHFYVRESSAQALGKVRSTKATLHLIKVICRDRSKEVINHSINSLGFIRDTRALDTLIYILTGNEPGKGKHPYFPFKGDKCNSFEDFNLIALSNAVLALGRIQDIEATPALVQSLNHKSYLIRISSAQALSLVRNTDSLGPLQERLEVETSVLVKSAIKNAIYNIEAYQ
ncbi:MAG: HEAT repeat domain-containing protein [Deltaproteobacteria bacterium]|nr:MAG: HEAT repeat domain-containing protein [Deltaproteobacteria bacterium]